MKKLMTFVLIIAIFLCLVSCSVKKSLEDDEYDNALSSAQDVIHLSYSDLAEITTTKRFESKNNIDYDSLVTCANVTLSGYDVYDIEYVRYFNDIDFSGDERINIYWIKDMAKEASSLDSDVRFHFFFKPRGVSLAAIDGYSKVDGYEDFYTRDINTDKIFYVILLNEKSICRFVVKKELPNVGVVVDYLYNYGQKFKAETDIIE